MIYTVTLNPAIDYVIKVDNFETGIVNRTKQETCFLVVKELMFLTF